MAVSRSLRRLLRIRELEEEQRRLAVEAAVAELRRLEASSEEASLQQSRGRRLLEASIREGVAEDRLAARFESAAGTRRTAYLLPMIEDQEMEVGLLREQLLEKRVERRQAETLIREAEAREALEQTRRAQQGLDDWYRNRQARAGNGADANSGSAEGGES